MRDADRTYYIARALEERALCEKLTDPSIKAIHLELAFRYEAAARGDTAEGDGGDTAAMG